MPRHSLLFLSFLASWSPLLGGLILRTSVLATVLPGAMRTAIGFEDVAQSVKLLLRTNHLQAGL